jgi:uncharacterized protein YegP (UPF0339 family)
MATPKFELYTDSADHWRWRLKDSNGIKIASSGEWFASKASAKRAAENVRTTAPGAIIENSALAMSLAALLAARTR